MGFRKLIFITGAIIDLTRKRYCRILARKTHIPTEKVKNKKAIPNGMAFFNYEYSINYLLIYIL